MRRSTSGARRQARWGDCRNATHGRRDCRDNRRVTKRTVGIIGVGNMGLAMAQRLCEGGHDVRVRDVRAEREAMAERDGARACATPAALAAQCAVVIVAVVDAAQTEAVLFGSEGAVPALPAGSCVVLCPTIAPESVEGIAARLDALGVAWIEAPMSGGPVRARAGTMSLMVACRDAVFARHEALLA
ncbi:MAG: NAD(P)-binding domain-containing protein, partial [Pseudomonadota bacterium]|nr:NAD(P)-binding domain-containing protein [Pseudomonadota bacterium]